ncbi:MAG: trimeric intracellular cation channel family protein [Woeseiaceae bacterium]|nr:trimeric intracellular cation channel family protein [Woeseiaceae bacterium]
MNVIYILEMIGTAAFAISGALAASRKNMDIFGFCVLALMPAVGGGTLRDLILGRTPVFWVADNSYVIVALVTAVIAFFGIYRPGTRQRLLIWADAMGLALFAALGTEISLEYNAGPIVAIMLGVATAVTGGMIRDIIVNEIPLVLSKEIYATAAFVTGVVFVLAEKLGAGDEVALIAAVIAGFGVRALAIRYNWSLPAPRVRR